jgi:hypothetical protein
MMKSFMSAVYKPSFSRIPAIKEDRIEYYVSGILRVEGK